MNHVLVEFFILGRIPGTDVTVGYRTSLIIAGTIIILVVAQYTLQYRLNVIKRLKNFSPAKLIELKSI